MGQKNSADVATRELRGPWPWLATVVAVILTLAVIAGLIYSRRAANQVTEKAVGSAVVSGVGFSCRLPVLAGASGGFIRFPDGTVTLDAKVTLNPGKGQYMYSYDAAVQRWVPVPGSAISPDRRSYAYIAQTTGIPGQMTALSLHTREIATAKDRILWEGSGTPMGPDLLSWLSSGIYFSAVLLPAVDPEGLAFPAVYMVDPNHPGGPRRVGPNPAPQPPSPGQAEYAMPEMFTLVGGDSAWATGNRVPTESPSPNKPPAPGTFGPDSVVRMDLRDGRVDTWFTVSGDELVSLMGLDNQGRPILLLFQPKAPIDGGSALNEPPLTRVLLLTGPNRTVELSSGNDAFHPAATPLSDTHGIWFGSWNSVWLYTQSDGLRQVATVQAGLFPSPSPPPGFPAKSVPAPGANPGMPAYMQGTVVAPAGSCT